jgi:N-acetylglucosaminyldiphosphoundecaprenol N-acetyl-beta-D-mannosaminyltransferase
MAHTRINFLSVPVDIIPEQNLAQEIMEISQKDGSTQICFVTIWDILKARMNQDYMNCLKNSSLVIPISKSILKGASFLKLEVPTRYNPFKAVISIMNALDKNYRTLYMLGSRRESLMAAERNVRATFSGLRIVGRYVGYYPKTSEADIVEAIFKAAPTLTLLSDGVSGADMWYYRRRKKFTLGKNEKDCPRIFLYYKDCFGIFSKRKRRVSEDLFNKGLELLPEIVRNPFKIFLIFPYIWYLIVLLWYKIFKK